MTVLELQKRAALLGLRLEPRGEKLAVIPADRCPADFADELRQHKGEILKLLARPRWQRVPPCDLPLKATLPTPTSDNARRAMSYIVDQTDERPGPLCEWCLRRETAYWLTYHWPDEVCAYAAARDAACWQLNMSEPELWDHLGRDEQ